MAPARLCREGLPIHSKTRHQAASLALFATIGLTCLKLAVAFLSNSVGVLSEGIHSFLDLVAAGVSFYTVREATKPADADHPYGHGKLETLSSLFESMLLMLAAAVIIFEGVSHLIHPRPVEYQGLTVGVMIFSLLVSLGVYYHNLAAAELTESPALHVNALHFLSDVVASAGVLFGLIILKVTGLLIVDGLIALAVAFYILVLALQQTRIALAELADTQLPGGEIEKIQAILNAASHAVLEIKDLRTRKGGVNRHIDFHLIVCGQMTVEASHQICDLLEDKIQHLYPAALVQVHVEPCAPQVASCQRVCPLPQQKALISGHSVPRGSSLASLPPTNPTSGSR